jgi:p-hydroxybenzoate 3-monooxygenase
VFPLRSLIREPMSYGRLYLLGDSAHIIPPMGAKGMNLALFDAETFAAAVRVCTATSDDSALRGYSDTCLARTWRYQEYSNWLADMVHGASGAPVGGGGSFRERIMRARLERLLSSGIAARYYAECSLASAESSSVWSSDGPERVGGRQAGGPDGGQQPGQRAHEDGSGQAAGPGS